MFYQIDVNRIAHTGINIDYGDTVALIKGREIALEFAQRYSEISAPSRVVRVRGPKGECFFINGYACTWSGRAL